MLPSADTGNERESRRSGWRRHLALAASLLLVFTLGWTAYLGVFPGFGTTQAQHFRTGVGQTTTVTLPAGSVVTLDAETEMRLRETPGERRVDLVAGRAFFRERQRVGTGTGGSVRVDRGWRSIIKKKTRI